MPYEYPRHTAHPRSQEPRLADFVSGLLRDTGDHFELTGPLRPMSVSATLRDSLTARLDRIAPAKEMAQSGFCYRREFRSDLLAAATGFDDSDPRSCRSDGTGPLYCA